MKTRLSHLLSSVVAALLLSQVALAATYRYNENAPPAKMMLDMMEVMGVIERVPDANTGHRRTWPVTSLWGMNPRAMSPAMMPPGVMNPAMINPMMGRGFPSGMGAARLPYGTPANRFYPRPVLPNRRPAHPSQVPWQNVRPAVEPPRANSSPVPAKKSLNRQLSTALWSAHTIERQLADFAQTQNTEAAAPEPEHQPASIHGIWQGRSQAVLELTEQRFIWTTASGKSNSGFFKFDGKILTTSIPNHNVMVRYQIELTNDQLVATSESGNRYEFQRRISH